MATTTTAFEAEILAFTAGERGLMAGPAYRLRTLYQQGFADPTAHTLAKFNSRQVAALTRNNELASFDAITAP